MLLTQQQKIALTDRNVQIGNICYQWAHLEHLLFLSITSVLRLDNDTGKLITSGLDILPRVNLALKLAKHLRAPPQAIKGLEATRSTLQNGLLDRRNRAIHGHRLMDPGDPFSELVETNRGKGANVRRPQTNADLAALGKDIANAARALHHAMLYSGVFTAECWRPARIIALKTSETSSPTESNSTSKSA